MPEILLLMFSIKAV